MKHISRKLAIFSIDKTKPRHLKQMNTIQRLERTVRLHKRGFWWSRIEAVTRPNEADHNVYYGRFCITCL